MSLCVPIFNGEYYERKHGFCWGVQRVFNLSHLEPQNKATNSPGGSMDHNIWLNDFTWVEPAGTSLQPRVIICRFTLFKNPGEHSCVGERIV